jgi:hypothetical protein
VITNGIWGMAAIAAVWSLVHFGKVKVSSPAVPKKAAGTKAPPESGSETEKLPSILDRPRAGTGEAA